MAEIKKFEGDLFWNADDPEASCYDPVDELDNIEDGDIVEFEQAKRLPNFFGVLIDGEERYFDTLEEAEYSLKSGHIFGDPFSVRLGMNHVAPEYRVCKKCHRSDVYLSSLPPGEDKCRP